MPLVSAWGTGPWGVGAWGGIGGPTFMGVAPVLLDTKGGTGITIFGSNFRDPTTVDILDGSNIVVGRCYYFEARLDLRSNKLLVGTPPLPAGSYGIQITTPSGTSPIFPNVLTYAPFADEGKVLRMRRRFASIWATGERIAV